MSDWKQDVHYLPSRPLALCDFPKTRGIFFGGPYNTDSSILGSKLGSHYLGDDPV